MKSVLTSHTTQLLESLKAKLNSLIFYKMPGKFSLQIYDFKKN